MPASVADAANYDDDDDDDGDGEIYPVCSFRLCVLLIVIRKSSFKPYVADVTEIETI